MSVLSGPSAVTQPSKTTSAVESPRNGRMMSAVQMERRAMPAQPGSRRAQFVFAAEQLGTKPPEGRAVVHMLQMRHLMRHEIAGHYRRSEQQAPGE